MVNSIDVQAWGKKMLRSIGAAAVVAALVLPVLPARAETGQGHLPKFYGIYLAVSSMREEDPGKRSLLLDLSTLEPKAAEFLADFWWGWGVRSCGEDMERAKGVAKSAFSGDPKGMKTYLSENMDSCVMEFTYTNWDEVQKSVITRIKNLKK